MIDKIFDLGLKDFVSFYPQEFVTLREALDGKLEIKLNGGFTHHFNEEEVKRLSKIIPIYMWSLIKLPFVIVKTLQPGEYLVNGSEWELKALSLILDKDVKFGLRTGDVEKLIKNFKSLIIITLSPIGISSEDEENGYY